MKKTIEQFLNIILSFNIEKEGIVGLKEIERSRIVFIDKSILVVYESVQPTKYKYGYHWMDFDNITLFRWDNTPHFPQFDTFPFHRHVGEAEAAEAFPQVFLSDILKFISNRLI